MRGVAKWALAVALLVGCAGARMAWAQASFAATQSLALSAFGGVTGNWTNLEGGRNVGITAGVDLALPTYHRFRPVLEARGTYPIAKGQIDGQKEFLGGFRVERQYDRLHPYVDFLAGRGQMDYQNGGFSYGDFTYLFSTSTVYSGGVGADYDMTPSLALKVDFQVQHWDTPFTASAATVPVAVAGARRDFVYAALGTAPQTINPRMVTLGVVYRFDFNPHHRKHY